MLSKFKYIKHPLLSSLPLHHFNHPTKNPHKTLNLPPKLTPKSLSTTTIIAKKMSSSSPASSWSCSACTFLNPPSQKLTCQICQTPSSLSSATSPSKWVCKACTFLNSYSRNTCEICGSRAISSLDQDDDLADPFSSSPDVGSVFFPLRKCTSLINVDDDGDNDPNDVKIDLGFKDKVQIQMGTDHIDTKRVNLGGSSANLGSYKRKAQEPASDSAGAVNGSSPIRKQDSGDGSAVIVDDTEFSASLKRKRGPGSSMKKSVESDEFRDVKSSKNILSVSDDEDGTMGQGSVSVETAKRGEVKKAAATVKILSYNVWFREDLEAHQRMEAIGDLIQMHSPDVICFQEVTLEIYKMFQRSTWWKRYQCSVTYERASFETYFCMQLAKLPVKSFSCRKFSYTAMSRELCIADVTINENKSLVVATTHLESPSPGPPKWDQMYSKERVDQAREAISFLQQYPNVIFCGDMNWDDKLDGRFPYSEGWVDVWEKLRPAEVGWTYDTKANKMLTGNRTLQKRLDRFICHLPGFEIRSIDMIGTEAIPGVNYKKEKKTRGKIQELSLPVYPSDHFGLLLTIASK